MAAPPPAWAAPYVGLPYREGGRGRDGVDCWGLFRLVRAEVFGRELPPYEGPGWHRGVDRQAIGAAAEAYSRQFAEIPLGQEEPGDGLLIRMRGQPIHLALVVGGGWMLHAEEGVGSCLEAYGGVAWRHRILGVYRHA